MSEDYSTIYRKMTTPQLISEAWDKKTETKERDAILTMMTQRTAKEGDATWPTGPMQIREEMAGLYPDVADPHFAARLYQKREFYEARAVAAGIADGTIDPCTSAAAEKVFELTPVQRIVSRFMHPLTPYMGLLLFHGVGVGKTCSAVTIAEQFLEVSPNTKVIVLVPQALKENFKRTVIDPSKLVWSDEEGQWQTRQCTGLSYLERLDLLTNPDIKAVTYKIEEDRRNRYTVTGYQACANWVEKTLKKSVPEGLTDPELRLTAENEVLRRLFSEHLIIVDEAHNLRDLAASVTGGDSVAKGEASENQGGKALNPYLKRIVLNAEGLRLVFMSATPMYNLASEIILLLNYLAMNDSKKELGAAMSVTRMFGKDGALLNPRLLERLAKRYVSYMRGENPYTFPLRMHPLDAPEKPASLWPTVSATKNPVVLSEEDTAALNALPIVFTEPVPGSPVEVQLRSSTIRGRVAKPVLDEGDEKEDDEEESEESEGKESEESEKSEEPVALVDAMLDQRMQIGNISYPNSMYGGGGFDSHFTRSTVSGSGHKLRVFSPKGFDVDSVFHGESLRAHAPKIHRIVESVKAAKGICFVYSRYIKAGALPLAIALERAGFQRRLADGRIAPLLVGGAPVPPICAVCGSQGGDAHAIEHTFVPACYILLTSEDDLSPNFPGLVRLATTWSSEDPSGPLGSNVKVVIGSQVASEGLDLKCVREMHVMDSWYHLNRTDQIIGRAIRYCSHTALRAVEERQGLSPMSLNNCLIYLHAIRIPETTAGPAFESADMYAYRLAIGKAQMVGKVQRILKKNAWDCNLELEAITFAGLPPRKQIDAQGNDRKSRDAEGNELDGYNINDQDYTTYCDYQRCRHECAVTIPEDELKIDNSTFGILDARRLVLAKQTLVRRLFQDQVMVPESMIKEIFSDLPWEIASEALMELIDGRRFKLRRPDGVEGFLIKKAGHVVFQPADVTDTDIPLTMRYARAFQLSRHLMTPELPVFMRSEPREVGAAASIVAGAPVGPTEPKHKEDTNALLLNWKEWLAFVESRGEGEQPTLPKHLNITINIWTWILARYAGLPETRLIALRWWFDKVPTMDGQRYLMELAISDSEDAVALRPVLDSDMNREGTPKVYRIFNPEEVRVQYFCSSTSAFKPCPPNIVAALEKMPKFRMPPVRYPSETGELFGFVVAKSGATLFKTLDITKPIKKSSLGAACDKVSNMGEHRPRVQILQAAARTSEELAPLMLPDVEEEWEKKDKGDDIGPRHLWDITQQTLCLYM